MGNTPSTSSNSTATSSPSVSLAKPLTSSPKRRQNRRSSNFIGAGKLKQAKSPALYRNTEEKQKLPLTPISDPSLPKIEEASNDSVNLFKSNYSVSGGDTNKNNLTPSYRKPNSSFDAIPRDEFVEHVENSSSSPSNRIHFKSISDNHGSYTDLNNDEYEMDLDDDDYDDDDYDRYSENYSGNHTNHNNTIHDDIINKEDEEVEANRLLYYMTKDDEYENITVPVTIKWKSEKNVKDVHVVGSFTNWVNKIRLHKISEEEFAVQLYLRIGFYRFQFIVDGQIKCSDSLPKATEANGNFVNWFEVVKSNNTPSISQTQQENAEESQNHEQLVNQRQPRISKQAHHYSGKVMTNSDQDYFGSVTDSNEKQNVTISDNNSHNFNYPILTPVPKKMVEYTNEIPPVYLDTDDFDDNIMDATTMLKFKKIPEPPSLPPYLSNVLLNNRISATATSTPGLSFNQEQPLMKSSPGINPTNDTNILSVPNHVILNHLITTSIKNNVLAVACISRYAGKFVTQVTYSPIDMQNNINQQ